MKRVVALVLPALLSVVLPATACDTRVNTTTAAFTFPHYTPDKNPLMILGPAGELFVFQKTCATTRNWYALADATIPPGGGPLPHIHHYTDEWFYFPDGGLTIEMGEQEFPTMDMIPGKTVPKETFHEVVTKPGDIFYGPRFIMHGFYNGSKLTHHLIFVWTPDDGIVDYFREVGQHVEDPEHLPKVEERNKELFVSQAPKYGINQSSSYDQYLERTVGGLPPMDPHLAELNKLITATPTDPAQIKIPCNQ
jgi:mannose-6-phosphate isomerase-like protein (cupin superfamily)